MSIEKQVLSVQSTTFKNDKDGTETQMWKVYIADDTGAVGCIYSRNEIRPGDTVTLGFAVNKDGKFIAKILNFSTPQPAAQPVGTKAGAPKGKGDDLPF